MASTPAAPAPSFLLAVDGGGTRTQVILADAGGRVLARRTGPPGIVDPRDPRATADRMVPLLRATATDAGATLPVATLCAGLAGVGAAAERERMRALLDEAGVAERVLVLTDGEIALDGALAGDAGILLVAGTGSVAYGRAEDGRVERCGGWGMILGDEGSGYAIAIAGLRAALHADDGRGEPTRLLPDLLAHLGLDGPRDLPPWAGRADKADIAALAPLVIRLGDQGDAVAGRVLTAAADALARQVEALVRRLGPWSGPVPLVRHGGVLRGPGLTRRLEERLRALPVPIAHRAPAGEPVDGALRRALATEP